MEIATEVDIGHWFAMTGSDGPTNSNFSTSGAYPFLRKHPYRVLGRGAFLEELSPQTFFQGRGGKGGEVDFRQAVLRGEQKGLG